MRKTNPSWEVVRLTHGCAGFPPPPPPERPLGEPRVSAAQQADWYRLHALAAHGGVYLDATCVTLRPLEEWVDLSRAAVQGFALPHDGTTLESWAIAAPRGSALMARWRDEFVRAMAMGHDERGLLGPYCAEAMAVPRLISKGLRASLPYLAIHAAWCTARNALADEDCALRSAVELGAPYRYLAEAGWDSAAAVSALFACTAEQLARTPLIKLRGRERGHISSLASYGRASFLARELLGATVPTTMTERLAFIACGLEPP